MGYLLVDQDLNWLPGHLQKKEYPSNADFGMLEDLDEIKDGRSIYSTRAREDKD